MTMTTIDELIERCRKAEGPDRELDASITVAVGDAPGEGWELITHRPGVFMMDAGRWIKGGRIRTPKPFTASIDAITALIEKELPGWMVVNLCEWEADILRQRGPWQCTLKQIGTQDDLRAPKGRCDHAPTAPLALCLAFLLALKSLGEQP